MNSCSRQGRRQRVMVSLPSLPQNTVTDILARLPVKSLTRFKSVSKNWAQLTSSPAFISDHLRRSDDDPRLFIRRFHILSGLEFGFWLITNPTHSFDYLRLDIPVKNPPVQLPRVVGCVTGLVCLDISPCYASDFVLWNPGTKLYNRLPLCLITPSSTNPIWKVYTGFGFDSINNDYKLVRIVSIKIEDGSPVFRVEVYSWKDGVWKELEDNSHSSVLLCGVREGVAVDGSLNWLGIDIQGFSDQKVVISFDLRSEVFKRIPLPLVTRYGNVKLLSYMGSLAVAVYPIVFSSSVEMNRFEFWVLKDLDGGSKDWVKLVSLDNVSKYFVPMGCWRDQVMMRQIGLRDRESSPSLLFFDPDEEKTERIPIEIADYHIEGWNYVESLVSVDGTC